MSARHRSGGKFHAFIQAIRRFIDAFKQTRGDGQAAGGRAAGGAGGRPNPWPQCPLCHRRVPSVCTDAEEGAEPCGNGVSCGCCYGPHRAEKGAQDGRDDGKFTTSVQSA